MSTGEIDCGSSLTKSSLTECVRWGTYDSRGSTGEQAVFNNIRNGCSIAQPPYTYLLPAFWYPLLDVGLFHFLPRLSGLSSLDPSRSHYCHDVVSPSGGGSTSWTKIWSGVHTNILRVHLSSVMCATWPAQRHFAAAIFSMTSVTLVCLRISTFLMWSLSDTFSILRSMARCITLNFSAFSWVIVVVSNP